MLRQLYGFDSRVLTPHFQLEQFGNVLRSPTEEMRVPFLMKDTLTPEEITALINCQCVRCATGREHKHGIPYGWFGITHLLLKSESLDKKDSIPLEACELCGHKRPEGSK